MRQWQVTHKSPVRHHLGHTGSLADNTLGNGFMGEDDSLGVTYIQDGRERSAHKTYLHLTNTYRLFHSCN